jgi:uncharacterized protein
VRFEESRFNLKVAQGDSLLMFNTLAGTLTRLSVEERQELDRFLLDPQDQPDQDYPSWIADLIVDRMVVSSDFDELAAVQEAYQRAKSSTNGLGLTIVSSSGCNFDCDYCRQEKRPSVLSDDVQAHILSFVESRLTGVETLGVVWYGGEPLLGRESILALSRRFLDLCRSRGVRYNAVIVTNGYLLTAGTARELKDHGVDQAQVTLDGPPEIHDARRHLRDGTGTFWRIVDNILGAVHSLEVVVRINVDKLNVLHAERLLAILRDVGLSGRVIVYLGRISGPWKHRCFSGQQFAGIAQEFDAVAYRDSFFTAKLPQAVGTLCPAVAKNAFVIGSEGELYKCWESVGDRGQAIGHVRQLDSANFENNRWVSYDPFANAECRECRVLPVCMGGCVQHAMDLQQYANRCSTFRYDYEKVIDRFMASRATQARLAPATATET